MATIDFRFDQSVPQDGTSLPVLNESQTQALDLSRHVAITASAGSGKTTVLVERFLRILEERGFHPEQIVAITFTEEAAAQLKERIREAVEKRRIEAEAETSDVDNPWRRAARFLSLAKIGTIHGFCLSLLREYPLDAGLDPDFRVLSPGEQEMLLAEQVDESLRVFSLNSHPDLAALLDYLGRPGLAPTLRQLIRRRNYLGRLSPGQWPVGILEAAYRKETAVVLLRRPEWTRLRQALSGIPPRLVRDTSSCARRCRRQIALFQRRDAGMSDEEFITDFQESFAIRVSPSKAWKESGRYETLKTLWDELKEPLRKNPLRLPPASARQDHHFRRAVDSLSRLYTETLETFQNAKRDQGVLDFEDLLDLTRQLLEKPSVQEAVQRRYRFFLVDEFQDTNHVQWEILRPLLGPESNFFAVGDAKQSIYRFRDADVSIFEQVQDWIGRRGRVLEMPENYRSAPELVRFNNLLFGGLFQKDLPFEAAHQEMRACRRAGLQDAGRVETCFYDSESEVSESRLTTARIRRFLDEEGRRPEEIAVLLRTRTRLKEYERAMHDAGIPFCTVGGVGFYDQQEVLDLLNAARFLVNPIDDVALLGTLRSPLFNFSDEDLFVLSRLDGESFWEKWNQAAGEEPLPDHWKFALDTLSRWRAAWRTDSVAEFFRRVLRDTGLPDILSQSARARQSLGNLSKLLETAREFERSERRGLGRFVRFIDALEASDAAEPEADSAGPGEDQVRVYTIHGAKGLQFPVVVVPELGVPFSSSPSDRVLVETLRHGAEACAFLGFKIRDPEDGYRELSHPVFQMLRELDENRRIAEEKRLLYVAFTRAQHRLVLIGRDNEAASPARWLAELGVGNHAIEISPSDLLETTAPPKSTQPESIPPAVSFGWDAQPEEAPLAWEKTIWTPTEISLWKSCPHKFRLSVVDGLSPEHPLALEPRGDEAALVGSAVHDIFEKTPDLTRATAVQSRVALWLDRLEVLVPDTPRAEMKSKLDLHVSRLAGSDFYRRMESAERMYREKRFQVRSRGLLVTGVIDRLFQEKDGHWVVVDFKTNSIAAEKIPEKVAELGYDLQVELYLWAVSEILATERLEGVLFFTHSGTVQRVPFDKSVAVRCREILASLPRAAPALFPKTTHLEQCRSCGFFTSGACTGI